MKKRRCECLHDDMQCFLVDAFEEVCGEAERTERL